MVQTDAELVLRACNSEMNAFHQLTERYKKKIYYTAYGIVGNHHDAEDVLQETMLLAIRSLPKLRQPSGFGAWVLRIAYNRAVDICRKRKREVDPEIGDTETTLFDHMQNKDYTADPESMFRAGEISRNVKLALENLPESQRNAFMMKHVAHLSIKEIAVATNSTEATVKTNIYRAVQRMRSTLAPLVTRGMSRAEGSIEPSTV